MPSPARAKTTTSCRGSQGDRHEGRALPPARWTKHGQAYSGRPRPLVTNASVALGSAG